MATDTKSATPEQQQQFNQAIGGERVLLSGDPLIRSGQMQGISRGTTAYGQNFLETGNNVQDIIQRRRGALDGADPASSQLREARNREVAMARARGASEGQLAQVGRDAETQIGRQAFQRQDQTLNAYQKLIGNVLGGQMSLEQGYAGLEKSGEHIQAPQLGQGAFGMSVICTELYRQGYIDDFIVMLDTEYGKQVRRDDPDLYAGYIAWAPTVVKWMQASRLVSAIVAIPAVAWAQNMAYRPNWLGRLVSLIGEPICRFIGRTCGRKIQST